MIIKNVVKKLFEPILMHAIAKSYKGGAMDALELVRKYGVSHIDDYEKLFEEATGQYIMKD